MVSKTELFNNDDYIQEGANPAAGVLLLACSIGDDYDNPKNRVLLLRDGMWFEFRSSGDKLVSIDADIHGVAYALGANGSVIQFDWKNPLSLAELKKSRSLFINQTVASVGPMRRIRVLGSDVMCAGSGGQLYQLLNGGKFEAFPILKINGEEATIEDISGSSCDNFFVVTSDGYGAKYEGTSWRVLDLPNNSSLNCLCTTENENYAIAGDKSTLLIGQADHWLTVAPINVERSYWGVAHFNSIVYAAHLEGIDMYDGSNFTSVVIPDIEQHEFVVLRNGVDGAWSFAGQSVGKLAGREWTPFNYEKTEMQF
jgi:hypothetical protein